MNHYRISRFVVGTWVGESFVLTSLISEMVIELRDLEILNILFQFQEPKKLEEVCSSLSQKEIKKYFHLWIKNKILTPVSFKNSSWVSDENIGVWKVHEYYFHLKSRLRIDLTEDLGFEKNISGKKIEPKKSKSIQLPRLSKNRIPTETLYSSLRKRESIRDFGTAPISLEKIGFLFDLSCKIEIKNGKKRSSYPSGSYFYSLNHYLFLPQGVCPELGSGVYRYLSASHALEKVARFNLFSKKILSVSRQLAQLKGESWFLMCMTTQMQPVSLKYGGMAYSLIIKELGCLIQSLYLSAHALHLGACALGTSSSHSFYQATKISPFDETHLGEMIIGLPLNQQKR